ncbi:MAG: hypothetical protein HQL09_04875 [Nitrospirae bacterium]|nr:hypothetical protein [Nitrospirota bacterium]
MMQKLTAIVVMVGIFLLGMTAFSFAADDMQKQVDAIKGVLPKFAIPMREVGARFQNMYFAAKGGNWGLAYYMSKYMNGALNPAKLTKPDEYPAWKTFYEETFAPVNKAIFAQDFKAFEKEYTAVINKCNDCHSGMGYGFIKVVKMKAPADKGIAYTGKSKAEDVPK